ncbi:MAG: nuclear transport factor 2 family protein [Candidatus Binataceae bacterium]
MDRQQKIDFVRGIWEAFARGDMKTFFAGMPEDVTWRLPKGGLIRGKSAILHLARSSAGLLKEYRTEIRRTYCDGDTVIIEMTNRAKTQSGKPYANDYCFFFELEDGKIKAISEYTDQLTVKEIVGDAEFDALQAKMALVTEPRPA